MAELSVPAHVDRADPAYVENPVTGERFHFHDRPADPETDPLGVHIWAEPDMSPLAAHVHELQDESFTVEEGRLTLVRDGVGETVTTGETVTVEAGVSHTWSNAGSTELHLAVQFDPALQSEAFLRDLAALARRGAVSEDGAPSMLQVAALYDAYGYDLLHLASPPLAVQKVVFGVLAPIARALGYRANPVTDAASE